MQQDYYWKRQKKKHESINYIRKLNEGQELEYFIYFLIHEKTPMYGCQPPSTKPHLIKEEAGTLHPFDGENSLKYLTLKKAKYTNVYILKKDLKKAIKHLRKIY